MLSRNNNNNKKKVNVFESIMYTRPCAYIYTYYSFLLDLANKNLISTIFRGAFPWPLNVFIKRRAGRSVD